MKISIEMAPHKSFNPFIQYHNRCCLSIDFLLIVYLNMSFFISFFCSVVFHLLFLWLPNNKAFLVCLSDIFLSRQILQSASGWPLKNIMKGSIMTNQPISLMVITYMTASGRLFVIQFQPGA